MSIANLVSRSRMRNIFGGPLNPGESHPMDEVPRPGAPVEEKPAVRPQTSESDRFFDEMMAARKNMPVTSQYKQMLTQAPERSQNKPTKMRRFGAAVVGGLTGATQGASAGYEAGNNIVEAPFKNAMQDYGTKLATLERGARIETDETEGTIKAMEEARRLGLSLEEFRHKQNTDSIKLGIDQQRADSYDDYVNNPDYQGKDVQGGVLYVNTKNPAQTHLVPGKTLSEINSETQRGMLGVARTNAGTNVRRTNIAERQLTHDTENDNIRTSQAGRALELRAQEIANKTGANAAQIKTARELALREMASDPDYRDLVAGDQDFPELKNDLDEVDFEDALDELDDRIKKYLGKAGGPSGEAEEDTVGEPEFDAQNYLNTRRRF